MRLNIRQPIRQAIRQSYGQVKTVAEKLGPNILDMSRYQPYLGKNLSFDATTEQLSFDSRNKWGELLVRFPIALSAGKSYKITVEQNLPNRAPKHFFDRPILSIKYANVSTIAPQNWTLNDYYGAGHLLGMQLQHNPVLLVLPANADTTGCMIGLTETDGERVTVKITVQEII